MAETSQEKIKKLEEQYTNLNAALKDAVKLVHSNEHNIVGCLQTLMPLQNSYLTGVITNLQNQVKQLQLHVTQQQNQPVALPPVANNIQPDVVIPTKETAPPRRRRNSAF